MVPALSHKVPRASWYSGYCPLAPGFHLRGFHPLWPAFPGPFHLPVLGLCSPNPDMLRMSVWAPPGSLAATSGITFVFFSSGYLDVSVHRVPPMSLYGACAPLHGMAAGSSPAGFPHSDIRGSRPVCGSPRLFAAYHVFLRLLVPRHPPCALFCLTLASPPSVTVPPSFLMSLSRFLARYLIL